jgi:Flp pilus assembly pilin Flp
MDVSPTLADFCSDRRGSTAIEYALVAALAGIAALGGIQAVGANTNTMWAETVTAIVAALTGA